LESGIWEVLMEVTVINVLPPRRRVPEVGESVSQGTVEVMVKSMGTEPAVKLQDSFKPANEGFPPLRAEHSTVTVEKATDPEPPILEVASWGGGGGGAAELPLPQP